MRRFREPTVFFRFEVSCVLAASPMCLLRALNPTRDLYTRFSSQRFTFRFRVTSGSNEL